MYRLLHIPSELYFIPSRRIVIKTIDPAGRRRVASVKSNLSKNGKVYTSKPSKKYIDQGYYNHLVVNWKHETYFDRYNATVSLLPFIDSEWVIEEL